MAEEFGRLTHQTAVREAQLIKATFFPKHVLEFVLTKEVFVPRPYFVLHLTDKRRAKLSWITLQILFSTKCCKPQLKYKIQL